ncbi:MAG TPA: DUF2087 domain-containing protein [Micromonosporaceae bacterium]
MLAFAATVLGARTPSEVASATGLPAREVVRALRRLEDGGLIVSEGGKLTASAAVFKDAIRGYGQPGIPDEPLDPDQAKAAVLRAFIRDGRLVSIPAAHGKRQIILEHIAACFEPGVRYPEAAVDAVLRAWHEDYVSLRRYLIDGDFMSREDNVYWRSGGLFEV